MGVLAGGIVISCVGVGAGLGVICGGGIRCCVIGVDIVIVIIIIVATNSPYLIHRTILVLSRILLRCIHLIIV